MAEGIDNLLPLALSRPREALFRARRILAGDPPPFTASIAHQAAGIVLREVGDSDLAVAELRTALRLARRSGSASRAADVLGTLGVALVFAGRTTAGRNALDAAVQQSTGLLNSHNLLRRGVVLVTLGRHREALADLNSAISTLRHNGDLLWEARVLTERASCHLALGRVYRASEDYRRAEELFALTGQDLESADTIVYQGVLALRIGALPTALACFDKAAERFDSLGTADVSLSVDRCSALMAAGLSQDALAEAETTLARLDQIRGQSTKRAELLLKAAECALAAGQPDAALRWADDAARLFGHQHRPWWRAHAQLVKVRAQLTAGSTTGTLLRDAERCVRELGALGSPDLPLAQLIAGRIALTLGRPFAAGEHLAEAAHSRRRGPALGRLVGWLAEALSAEATGDAHRLIRACRSGLAVLDEHRATLGSSELRAQTTSHGAELADLGLRHALCLGRPRMLLAWSERWRATTLAVSPVRPPDDEHLQAELAALRAITSRLSQIAVRGLSAAALHAEQARLERSVRARALRVQGADRITAGCDIPGLLTELGDDLLIELIDIDGELHILLCGAGKIQRFSVGSTEEVARHVDIARFGLTRLAHGRSPVPPAELLTRLHALGRRLNQLLLGEIGPHLSDRNVVIVPPGRLHPVPWALLPELSNRVLTVAPSAASWLRAHRAFQQVSQGQVVLVRGPGLKSDGAEIEELAKDYADNARVLGWGTATVTSVLEAMDGARLAHIATHGSFRADSPLFSALRMDDGPLTIYDLERLRRPPRQIILSSCDSGRAVSAGADELLGLATSLMQLGTTGITVSVVPLNDVAAVPLMIALHQKLRQGTTLPKALRDARRETAADPVATATGLSFISLGAS
jgi:tetratricopeptide (TPR) repeat protein